MERPVMEPSFEETGNSVPRQRTPALRRLWRLGRAAFCILFVDLLHPRRDIFRVEDGSPMARFVRGLGYRLAFTPFVLAGLVATMVYVGTHPPSGNGDMDPISQGLYYEPVSFLSEDGVRLEGWLIPALDARRVLQDKDKVLQKKQPAVVLVHDHGQSQRQMLPFVRPLHDAGLIVFVLRTRGGGTPCAAASTFGLNESLDVWSAVEMLRRRPFVDGDRIAVLGVGVGANAAMLAAQRDPSIAALVLNDPVPNWGDAINRYIAPQQSWLKWMQPLCKWTFEIAYQLDIDEIDVDRHTHTLSARPVLRVDSGEPSATLSDAKVKLIGDYLAHKLGPIELPVAEAQ